MRKHLTVLGTFLLPIASSFAVENKVNPGEENRGGCIPSSRFEVTNGYNFFLTADFLWWRAQEDGLYFGQEGFEGTTTKNPPNGSKNFNGKLAKISPSWEPGFKIGLGGNMPYDKWDIFLEWTWFQTNTSQCEHHEVLALWGHQDVSKSNVAKKAEGHWKLELNIVDLELGRDCWIGRHLSLRPFFGLRGAWIDQIFKIHYDFDTDPVLSTKIHSKSDFAAGGLRGGFDLRYNLFRGWSIYGQGAFSMLYGQFTCDFRERENDSSIAKSDDDYRQGIPAAEMAVGVRWDTYVHHNRYHFALTAAWEQNLWFDVNQMNHFLHQLHEGSMVKGTGNLTTQGGTFSARFDF
jgi:hypothetical protein